MLPRSLAQGRETETPLKSPEIQDILFLMVMIITGTSIVSTLVRYMLDQLTHSPEKQSQQQQTRSHLRHSTSDCQAADSLAFVVSLPPQRKDRRKVLTTLHKKPLSHTVFQVYCQLFQTCRTGQSHCI